MDLIENSRIPWKRVVMKAVVAPKKGMAETAIQELVDVIAVGVVQDELW